MFTFDPDKHEYRLDGKLLDNVTSVIREAGFMPSYTPADLEWYLERGRAIHKATELYDKGELDESTVDPRIFGYLKSWKTLNFKYHPQHIEMPLCDPIYGYAGTIDRLPLLDIKSGQPEKWHRIQLGAYYGLCRANLTVKEFPPAAAGMCVYLQEDGSAPKVITHKYTDLHDALKIFHAALIVIRAKREMNL